MQFSAKLAAAFGLLLTVAVASLVLAYWTARQADQQLARSELGHRLYSAHLSVKSDAYHLFKELSDALLIGDRDGGKTERRLEDSIRANLNDIRRMTAEEVALDHNGRDELEKLGHLALIESKLQRILQQYASVARQRQTSDTVAADSLRQLLDDTVDQSFAGLIDSAVIQEQKEVARADAEAEALLRNLSRTSLTAAILAALLAVASVYVLQRGVRVPLRKLTIGAEALASGHLDHVINLRSYDEFGHLARAFNRMTEEVAARQRAIDSSRQSLEVAVSERTQELQRANLALQRADDDRRRFLADVSHELRTPLTIMRGEAEIALRARGQEVGPLREALKRIEETAKHSGRLVDDLLFVARHDAGEARLRFERVDLPALVTKVCEEAEALAIKSRTRIVARIDAGAGVFRGDATKLRQLLLVLIDNAIRYGRQDGEVRVTLANAPVGFVIGISDDGIGMTQDEQTRAFDRYFRGAGAAERYIDGTGLGLPVAKAIAQAHGGDISIVSRPGEGTTMNVLLPSRPKLEIVA
ncbi:MAG: HAMP domain-containing sensor histidine kinase [Hyphomicrobiaceae bacterium]|nr:HAMP domain-containing sensor histidine kinase [Hyphomicrobiaceae bacterium]